MSVTESDVPDLPEPPFDDWSGGAPAFEASNRTSSAGDRTPPQDMAAEQSVLGAMMISKDAIADVAENAPRGRLLPALARDDPRRDHRSLRPRRAGRHGHRRRRAAEGAASCSGSAARRTSTRCRQNVPIAANAGYYADIVREKAILRRLVDAGTRIVQIGYAGEGDVDDIVDSPRPRSTRSPTSATARTTRRSRRSWRASSTRSRRSATATPGSTACRPASSTSTS